MEIFVNQIGYRLNALKVAYVTGFENNGINENESGKNFSLVRTGDNEETVVFKGKLKSQQQIEDRLFDKKVWTADFSDFSEAGTYKIKVDQTESFSFVLGDFVFNGLYKSTLQYFYLSRCGQTIELSDGKDWCHEACHTGVAEIYGSKETKSVLGGWHDAGDYGRYVVAGSKAVMDLLLAYEKSKESFKDFDILSEIRFELEWMLQMQREDGAVYHKISCYHFCAFIKPEEERDALVLSPISTAATADFAGCMAYCSLYFKDSDADFAKTILDAALKAQSYLDSHEDEMYKNPPEITTGGYGDWNVYDERYFAAAALFAVTGDKAFVQKAMDCKKKSLALSLDPGKPWMKNWIEAFGWGCVAGYGTEILLKNSEKIEDTEIVRELRKSVLDAAEGVYKVVENASFGTALTKVFWGSNGQTCDLAHLLLLAYDVTGEEKYYLAAKKQFDYILGCNPMNVCYVTGMGSSFVKNPHHRPSGAIGKTMPGMLSGGPCEDLIDEVAKKVLPGQPPLKCFADEQGSYSTNEVAIYWNSTFVYLISRMSF